MGIFPPAILQIKFPTHPFASKLFSSRPTTKSAISIYNHASRTQDPENDQRLFFNNYCLLRRIMISF